MGANRNIRRELAAIDRRMAIFRAGAGALSTLEAMSVPYMSLPFRCDALCARAGTGGRLARWQSQRWPGFQLDAFGPRGTLTSSLNPGQCWGTGD